MTPVPQTFAVEPTDHGSRLDLFLQSRLVGFSRSQIQKRIKQGAILVNHKPASVHHFLKQGDVVEEVLAPSAPSHSSPSTVIPSETLSPLAIIQETPDWLVINKPVGLLVHPDTVQTERTLVDLLVDHCPTIAHVGASPERPGIVHRLDKEVSGLMVIAKTQAAYENLQHQFAERRVKKTYLALIHHTVPNEEGDIKFRIARSSTKARMAARPSQEEEGQAAWTHYRVKQRFTGATLLELEILSGRTHQIRAHLLAMRAPIMGDPLYQLKKTDRNVIPQRLMLQSVGLAFDDPASWVRQSFHLDPDPAFAMLMSTF